MRKLFAMTSPARYAFFAPLALSLLIAGATPAGAKAITFGAWMQQCTTAEDGDSICGMELLAERAILAKAGRACISKNADDDVWPDAVFAYLQAQWTKHPELAAQDRDAVEDKVFTALWPCEQ